MENVNLSSFPGHQVVYLTATVELMKLASTDYVAILVTAVRMQNVMYKTIEVFVHADKDLKEIQILLVMQSVAELIVSADLARLVLMEIVLTLV